MSHTAHTNMIMLIDVVFFTVNYSKNYTLNCILHLTVIIQYDSVSLYGVSVVLLSQISSKLSKFVFWRWTAATHASINRKKMQQYVPVTTECILHHHSQDISLSNCYKTWTEETFLLSKQCFFFNHWPKSRRTTVTLKILLRNNALCESGPCVLSCLVCWKREKKKKKSAAQLCHTMAVPFTITGHPNKKSSETLSVSVHVFRLLDVFKQYRALLVTRDRKQQIRSKVAPSHWSGYF